MEARNKCITEIQSAPDGIRTHPHLSRLRRQMSQPIELLRVLPSAMFGIDFIRESYTVRKG